MTVARRERGERKDDAAARAIGEVQAGLPCAQEIEWKTNPEKKLCQCVLAMQYSTGHHTLEHDLPMRTDCCIFCSFA